MTTPPYTWTQPQKLVSGKFLTVGISQLPLWATLRYPDLLHLNGRLVGSNGSRAATKAKEQNHGDFDAVLLWMPRLVRAIRVSGQCQSTLAVITKNWAHVLSNEYNVILTVLTLTFCGTKTGSFN